MRKNVALITLAISISASLQAGAEDVNGSEGIGNGNKHASCEAYGKVAAAVMEASQAGVPISRLIEGNGVEKGTFLYEIILDAYEQPRFSSVEYQLELIANFRNKIEVVCHKN